MKVLFSIGTMSHGGAQRVISIISNQMIQMGHEVEILTYYDQPSWYKLNERVKITCDEKNIGKSNIFKHILFRRNYIKRIKPDAVLSFLAPFNMVMIIAMLGLNIPLIVADRNDPNRVPGNRLIRKLRDFLYNFADGVVVQSLDNKHYFGSIVQRKSAVIYNPIELDGISSRAYDEKKKDKIVCVGRIIKQKNPLLLARAFHRISDEYPSYSLYYYGEGEMSKDIIEFAKNNNLESRIKCPGPVENVYDNVKDAKLYVMSSDYEGMPNALLEAMCFGLPVISTKVSGATDVIINNQNGILVDCDSQEQLECAMKCMLMNETFASVCAVEAHKLADKLDKKNITECWLSFIEETINRNSK